MGKISRKRFALKCGRGRGDWRLGRSSWEQASRRDRRTQTNHACCPTDRTNVRLTARRSHRRFFAKTLAKIGRSVKYVKRKGDRTTPTTTKTTTIEAIQKGRMPALRALLQLSQKDATCSFAHEPTEKTNGNPGQQMQLLFPFAFGRREMNRVAAECSFSSLVRSFARRPWRCANMDMGYGAPRPKSHCQKIRRIVRIFANRRPRERPRPRG